MDVGLQEIVSKLEIVKNIIIRWINYLSVFIKPNEKSSVI